MVFFFSLLCFNRTRIAFEVKLQKTSRSTDFRVPQSICTMFNVMVDAKAQSTKLCSMEMGQEVKKKKSLPPSPFPLLSFPSTLPPHPSLSPISIDHIEENLTNSFPSLLVLEIHSQHLQIKPWLSVQYLSSQSLRHVLTSVPVTWKWFLAGVQVVVSFL